MKKIVIFGATGSIGKQALEIIKQDTNLKLVGFTYNCNDVLAKNIIDEFKVEFVYSHSQNQYGNISSWQELLELCQPDLVINSLTGFAGVPITQYCLEHKYKLALANKESLVVAGHLINSKNILPIDSEHSALYELINKYSLQDIDTVYITASGGPFYNWTQDQLSNVTFEQAINHPTWQMGYKISIDSATLVNKCLEIIEAYYLFGIEKIKVLYHPTSIVHGLIKTKNNAVISYLSYPDMKLPISLAINDYVITNNQDFKDVDFTKLNLHFEQINEEKFLPLKWAKLLIETKNPTIGTIITVVDDYVVELFKSNKINFLDITNIIDTCINKYSHYVIKQWSDIYNLREEILKDLQLCYQSKEYNGKTK